jgi:hypothetical protein
MRFRTYNSRDLTVSEVVPCLWTISTGWWESFTEGKAFDPSVTLFDAAGTDAYNTSRL